MRRLALFLLLPALSLHAASIRIAPGERVRLRSDGATMTVTGGDGDMVTASDVRRIGGAVEARGTTITVPRTAVIEWIATGRSVATVRDVAALHIDAAAGRIEATGIRGNIDGKTANANVIARNVGGNVVLSTGNGNITADGVRGLVDVTTGNGKNFIRNVAGGVHVVSINGATEVSCVAGAVAVEDTSGRTTVTDAQGDVVLFTALGQATYDGALRSGRSYRLRTLDGAVTLAYAPGGSGFSAELASDAAQIDIGQPSPQRQRRAAMRTGDESARIVLDAVGGRVALRKSTNARKPCQF